MEAPSLRAHGLYPPGGGVEGEERAFGEGSAAIEYAAALHLPEPDAPCRSVPTLCVVDSPARVPAAGRAYRAARDGRGCGDRGRENHETHEKYETHERVKGRICEPCEVFNR